MTFLDKTKGAAGGASGFESVQVAVTGESVNEDRGHPSAIALVVAYDGAPFCGFARQPSRSTVQGELEHALSIVSRRDIETVCAGRTDAGVHALGQMVSYPAGADEVTPERIRSMLRSLNALLPDEISIRDIYCAPKGFSARFDAVSREYRYRIVAGSRRPVFLREFSWWLRGELDVDAMKQAAPAFIGEHDFKSFCLTVSAKDKPTRRRVDAVDLFIEQQMGEECLVIRVVGNAFLHSMVRAMVGTLVEVGAGRRPVGWVAEAIAACERRAAGPTAPACGLTFHQVTYPEGLLRPVLPTL